MMENTPMKTPPTTTTTTTAPRRRLRPINLRGNNATLLLLFLYFWIQVSTVFGVDVEELPPTECTFSNMLSINGQGILGTQAACLFAHDCPKTAAVLQVGRLGIGMKMIGTRRSNGCLYSSVHYFGTGAEPYFSTCRTKTVLLGPFIVAMCIQSANPPERFGLSTAGTDMCDTLKEKVVAFCTDLRNGLDNEGCSNLYKLLENSVRHKTNWMESEQRLLTAGLATNKLGLDNLRRVLEHDVDENQNGDPPDAAAAGGQVPQGAGGANQNNANAGGAPAGTPPGGARRGGDRSDTAVYPTIIEEQSNCVVQYTNGEVSVNVAEMMTAAQKSMEKCKNEHRMDNRYCRNRVGSATAPFMSRADWVQLFPVNYHVFTKSRECLDSTTKFKSCTVLTPIYFFIFHPFIYIFTGVHHQEFGFCYPDEAPETKHTRITSPPCSNDLPPNLQCTHDMIRLETQPYWKKHATASSMLTMDVKDKFGNEIQHEIWWIMTTKTMVWMDYQASTAGQCCKFGRTAFLNSKPIFMRFVEQRTCMCDACGRAFAAVDELEDNYPVPHGKRPMLSMVYRLLNGRKASEFSFTVLHLNSDRAFEVPTDPDVSVGWNPPESCDAIELQGAEGDCVAISFVVLKIPSVAAAVDTASSMNTIEKKTKALAIVIAGTEEWRIFSKVNTRNQEETSISQRAQRKVKARLGAFESNAPKDFEIHCRVFYGTNPTESSAYDVLETVIQRDLRENPPPFEKCTKSTALPLDLFRRSGGIFSQANAIKKEEYDLRYAGEVEETDEEDEENNDPTVATCTAHTCNECSTFTSEIMHSVHRRSTLYPTTHDHLTCTLEDADDEDFEDCLETSFLLLGTYVTGNLGLQFTVVLSLFLPAPNNKITEDLQFMQVLLTPDGHLHVLSTTSNADEVLITYFGHFRESGPTRLTSWFLHRDGNTVGDYRITIHVAGPSHVFGPSESMIELQREKGGTHQLVPDNHYVFNLFESDMALRKQGLPTEDQTVEGSLAFDTAKRFEEITQTAGLDHIEHTFNTDYQQGKFEEEENTICSAYNIKWKKVIIIWDYKRNIPLMVKYKQLKSDYYNIPTAAFYGQVVIYCGAQTDANGDDVYDSDDKLVMVTKALNMDFTSPSHEKSAAWVMAAKELSFGLVQTEGSATCATPLDDLQDDTTTPDRSKIMGCGDAFDEGVKILREARIISYWGDNGTPFHSGNLISVMLAGKTFI